MSAANAEARALLNTGLHWLSLAYGMFATAIEPAITHEELGIASGIEAILLAVIGLLWAGARRQLGAALLLVGATAPAMMLGTASLFWDSDDVWILDGEAFWTSIGLGSAIGLPLVGLGAHVLRRSPRPDQRPDPAWFTPLRWVLQGGLLLILAAFRAGEWDAGIPLVYAGAAVALLALVIALPRRLAVTQRGIGLLLIFLGAAAVVVIATAAVLLGGNISDDEAAVGLLPAGIVAGLGVLLAITARRTPAGPAATSQSGADHDDPPPLETSAGSVDDIAIATISNPDSA